MMEHAMGMNTNWCPIPKLVWDLLWNSFFQHPSASCSRKTLILEFLQRRRRCMQEHTALPEQVFNSGCEISFWWGVGLLNVKLCCVIFTACTTTFIDSSLLSSSSLKQSTIPVSCQSCWFITPALTQSRSFLSFPCSIKEWGWVARTSWLPLMWHFHDSL